MVDSKISGRSERLQKNPKLKKHPLWYYTHKSIYKSVFNSCRQDSLSKTMDSKQRLHFNQFWRWYSNTLYNMTGQCKILSSSLGEKEIWIICSHQTIKYYWEINIKQVIVKVKASMTINSMFKCNKFNLAEVNEIIFQLQYSNHTCT